MLALFPAPPLFSLSPSVSLPYNWGSINSFNPVFLQIRLACWASAASLRTPSPGGTQGGVCGGEGGGWGMWGWREGRGVLG